jgi:hypothetical protein
MSTDGIRPRDHASIDFDARYLPECVGYEDAAPRCDDPIGAPTPSPSFDADIADAARNWDAHLSMKEPRIDGHRYDLRTIKGMLAFEGRLRAAGVPADTAHAVAEKIATSPAALHDALAHESLTLPKRFKTGSEMEEHFAASADTRAALLRAPAWLLGPARAKDTPLMDKDAKTLRGVAADPLVDAATRAQALDDARRIEGLSWQAKQRP